MTLSVLVAGGGAAAAEAVLALRALAGDRVKIDLLAPGGSLSQRPLSVLTPFTGEHVAAVPLARLPATLHSGALAAVDAARHRVRTSDGGELGYDRLIVATGARATVAVPGALTFRGAINAGAVENALRGAGERVLFVLPGGVAWALPVYELALLAVQVCPADLTIVTPEPRPLDRFGPTASDAVGRLLDRAGIEFTGRATVVSVTADATLLADGRVLRADAVIALPRLTGPRIPGLPADAGGFLAIDAHARVRGVEDVFAAGDVTDGELKQGGLATQQADAAAELIAAAAGADLTPTPYHPVLRAMLLTGEEPLYLRSDGATEVARRPLWSPPAKVAGRYLAAFVDPAAAPARRLADVRPARQ